VIETMGELLKAMYAVEPGYPCLAFPFWEEGTKFETAEAWDEHKKKEEANRREGGNRRKNKLRQYNLEVRNLQLVNIPAGTTELPNPKAYGLSDSEYDRFVAMRKAHAERCVLVALQADLESLQSDKVESLKADDPLKFFFVKKAEGWKLVYLED
jgi:hypothetical protein